MPFAVQAWETWLSEHLVQAMVNYPEAVMLGNNNVIVTTILIISFNTSIIISFVDSKTFIIIIFRVMDTKDETKNANQPILSNSVMFSVLLQDWNSKKVCKACCHREIVSN